MEAVSTRRRASPLEEFLRERVGRVLASLDATGPSAGPRAGKAALRRFLDALDALADAADTLGKTDSPEDALAGQVDPGEGILLAIEDEALANGLRDRLGPDQVVDVAPTPEAAFRSASARLPALIAASGEAAVETVRGVRELRPGLPALVVAGDSEVPRLLAAFADDPVVLLRNTVDPGELALAIQALLGGSGSPRTTEEEEEAAGSALLSSKGSGEPRSYAHLAGLLPRALERTIDFDVAAAVIARPGAEPLVDVHVTSHCDDETVRLVHDRARAIFRLIVGGEPRPEDVAKMTAPCSLRSSLHVPLATEGRVVGLTYLASFRENAFSATEERVLAALAAHASGAYRRLESSLRRLRLTPRQAQVLALIASGMSDKEVASRLGLAHRTVRTHLDRLLREHGLHSRTEAVAAWLRGKQD